MRVFYIDDIPTPYRLSVFRKITERYEGEFKIGFCADAEPGRTWELNFDEINSECIKGFQWRPPFQINPFSIKINLSIISVLNTYKPDLVIMSGYTHPTIFLAVLYCWIRKIPFGIVSETNEHCSSISGIRWWIKKIVIYPIIHLMSFGLPTGSQAKDYFVKLGCKNIPYFYFPNTPDISPIKKARTNVGSSINKAYIKKKYGIDSEVPIILFVGRLILAKNPIELVSAFNNLNEISKEEAILVIVGNGEQERVVQKAMEGNPNIKRIPWLDKPNEVYDLMSVADVFVLPSTHEPWGAVVNEALAAGCCVVTSDKVGSSYDLIEDGISGFIYKSGEINQLIDILDILIKSKNTRIRISLEGQKSASKFDQDYVVDNFINVVSYIKNNVSK